MAKPKPKLTEVPAAIQKRWTATAEVQQVELQPWMRRLGEWYAAHIGGSSRDERLAAARGYAGRKITRPALEFLEQRVDFQRYIQSLTETAVGEAKAIIQTQMPEVVAKGFEMARIAAEAGDYKEYTKYWNPMIDRAMPKQEERAQTAVQVVIQMGKESFASRAQAPDPNEIVVIEETT